MTSRYEQQPKEPVGLWISLVLIVIAALTGLITLTMWGCPKYRVYNSRKHGEAQLAQAQSNRQIAVLEATAQEEAAKRLAARDSIRAIGVASANKIIGNSLKQNDEYLTWLWVESLKEGGNSVIYVPTEANLPVLEAGRFLRKHTAPDTVK